MGKNAKVKEEKETVEEEITAENLPISDEINIEDNSDDVEAVEEEFVEVVGDSDEVINEIEEEVK
jgi:hypothetical protein